MKLNYWLVLGAMLSTGVLAQQATTPPASTPASTPEAMSPPAPATKSAEKKAAAKSVKKKTAAAKKPVASEKPVQLVPGPATVATDTVNVRGQATLGSEVVTRLKQGEAVTVLEQITLEKHKAEEPAQWAKIVFPEKADVWVRASFIDSSNKIVMPNKLNLRAGPGENFSVVGVLERGAPVREVLTDGEWMRIGAPTNAYAFIAAQYLKQEAQAVAATPPPTEPAPAPAPAPAPTSVAEPAPMAPAPTEVPVAPPVPAPAPVPTEAMTAPSPSPAPMPAEAAAAAPAPEPAPAVAEEPLPKRIVQHEGVVRNTFSIQAPTRFALVDPVTSRTINYLYTPSTNLSLQRYKGLHIIVTGEEGLDERWKNTPVITIQRIQVVE